MGRARPKNLRRICDAGVAGDGPDEPGGAELHDGVRMRGAGVHVDGMPVNVKLILGVVYDCTGEASCRGTRRIQ